MPKKLKKKPQKRSPRPHAALAARAPKTTPKSIIQRDPTGRTHLLTLAQPLFESAWQNDVALTAANTCNALLGRDKTHHHALEVARGLLQGCDKLNAGLLTRAAQRPACSAGCSHCCYQAVGVSAPEALLIADWLRNTRSAEALQTVATRIRKADDCTRGLVATERYSPEHPCPLLEDGRCSVYEVRPLACRGKNSLDAQACSDVLQDAEARSAFVSGALSVPCYLEPIQAIQALAAGLQLALAEVLHLAAAPLELTAALRILLDAPDTAAAWLAGQDAFREAAGGTLTDTPELRRLLGVTRHAVDAE